MTMMMTTTLRSLAAGAKAHEIGSGCAVLKTEAEKQRSTILIVGS
jgi:hypothetical protein